MMNDPHSDFASDPTHFTRADACLYSSPSLLLLSLLYTGRKQLSCVLGRVVLLLLLFDHLHDPKRHHRVLLGTSGRLAKQTGTRQRVLLCPTLPYLASERERERSLCDIIVRQLLYRKKNSRLLLPWCWTRWCTIRSETFAQPLNIIRTGPQQHARCFFDPSSFARFVANFDVCFHCTFGEYVINGL